jgi:hypothetical protein
LKPADETARKVVFSRGNRFLAPPIKRQGDTIYPLNRISKGILWGQLLVLEERKRDETFPLTSELCERKNTRAKKTLADRIADSKFSSAVKAFCTSWTVQLTDDGLSDFLAGDAESGDLLTVYAPPSCQKYVFEHETLTARMLRPDLGDHPRA